MQTTEYVLEPEVSQRLIGHLLSASPQEIVLLPRETDEGTAIYHETHIAAVKVLRSMGLDASYLVDPEERGFVSEFSHDLVYDLAVGIAGGLTIESLKMLWRYVRHQSRGLAPEGETPRVRLHVARLKKKDRTLEGVTLEGPATEQTPAALLALLVKDDD